MNAKRAVAVLLLLGMTLGVCFAVGRGFDRGPNLGRPAAADGASTPAPAPEFTGVTAWVNSEPLKLADQKGKVVIVHFWTNGCVNCIHNYPHYRAWQDKYKDNKDLLIIGVHTPEFDAEKDVDRIRSRMAKNQLKFAVAVDNDWANWKAWGNRYWPCIYLVDKKGNVRHRWEGELGDDGYKKVTAQIGELLAEQQAKGE
jgi:thiol-disulfide isomerase/thioredoxin